MLPTKLASAALRGTRSVAGPPAVVEVMGVLLGVPAAASESRRVETGRGPVRSAVRRCCVARGARGHRPPAPPPSSGGGGPAAYVPTGYVPNGEVIVVTCQVEMSGISGSRGEIPRECRGLRPATPLPTCPSPARARAPPPGAAPRVGEEVPPATAPDQ